MSKQRMPISAKIGPVLKQVRDALGLKQESVAQQAGLSAVAVCRMENGLTCSASDNYEREAEALGVSYELVTFVAGALAQRSSDLLTAEELGLILASRRL